MESNHLAVEFAAIDASLSSMSVQDRAGHFDKLGNLSRGRFEETGNAMDIDLAILEHRKAIELSAPDSDDRRRYLHNFSCALLRRAVLKSSVEDLGSAAAASEEALA